jgi:ABC-2 type transport system ATP-binding protein
VLSPEGIFWMRGLLRDFADRGGAVLLSSHLLREVEATADRLVVIGNGRIVADGAKEELLTASGTGSARWTRMRSSGRSPRSAWRSAAPVTAR